MKHKLPRILGRALAVAVTGAGLARAEDAAPAPDAPAQPENSFIRFIEDDDTARLQTSVTTYENANGVKVELIGAVHIADEAYFKGLNELFKGYEVLLYELVGKPEELEEKKEEDGNAKANPKKEDMTAKILKGSQLALLDVLKLQHQMAHVDYTPANLLHADVSWEKFRELQKEKGENLFTMLQGSIKAQDKLAREQRKQGIKQPGMRESIAMLAALYKASRGGDATDLKLIMGRQMEQAERLMSHMEDEKGGSVIITERNKVALDRFDEQVAGGKKNLGIFYGAGHFPDMEKRLIERGFQPKQSNWRTAWEIPKKASEEEVKPAA
ncbi:MAG: hypothetical protein ACKO2G_08745 [Verrucomicrobiales bacterium]